MFMYYCRWRHHVCRDKGVRAVGWGAGARRSLESWHAAHHQHGLKGDAGIYRLEIQSIPGTGKANVSGVAPREAVRVAFDYFKANPSRVSASIKPGERDFHTHLVELQNSGAPQALTLASSIALCSAALAKAGAVAVGSAGRHESGRWHCRAGTQPGRVHASGV